MTAHVEPTDRGTFYVEHGADLPHGAIPVLVDGKRVGGVLLETELVPELLTLPGGQTVRMHCVAVDQGGACFGVMRAYVAVQDSTVHELVAEWGVPA